MAKWLSQFAITIALLFSGTVRAYDYKLESIEIDHPWARATLRGAPTGIVFLTLSNTSKMADRLISARSQAAGTVRVYEMNMEGNVMRMRELDKGLEIPADSTVTLAPGGFHLMMEGLKAPLRKDTRVPLTLVFEKAGTIDIEFNVEAMDATAPSDHSR